MNELADRIYEAAFVPELSPEVLGAVAAAGGCVSGAMLVVDRRLPPLFAATSNVAGLLGAFAETPAWYDNPRVRCLHRHDYAGFMDADEAMNVQEHAADRAGQYLRQIGLGIQLGTGVRMPGGEMVSFSFERALGAEPFEPATIKRFDGLRPHLARASMIAARMSLQRAEAGVDTMQGLGIPAAVISASGAVLLANRLFEAMDGVLIATAFGRLALRDRQADRLLQASLPRHGGLNGPAGTRSIPVSAPAGGRPSVFHVMPLERAATDIFHGGATMLVVSGYALDGNVPDDAVLRGLFDLSPSEAGIAAGLAAGHTLAEVARLRGIGMATARTHLAQVLRKTGTSQQGQLIALLKGSVSP